MANILTPFQLLELNVISAQDLANVSRKMKTYAVAWVNHNRKLSTRIDFDGCTNPTWNDKFVFRVDDAFLHGDTSAVMIEIYAVHWFRDIHVGTVRAIVGNLIRPSNTHNHRHHLQLGMRFVALQVRRPSGRPQGILNIGVAILDSSMRSMPLYTLNSSSAVGYRHLMGEDRSNKDEDVKSSDDLDPLAILGFSMPELRRTKSDSSSMVGSLVGTRPNVRKEKTGSDINYCADIENKKAGQAIRGGSEASSCIITGSDDVKKQTVKKKTGSLVNGSDFGGLARAKYGSEVIDGQSNKIPSSKSSSNLAASDVNRLATRLDELDLRAPYGAPRPKNIAGRPIASSSELGPSPSEVAQAIARKRRYRVEETESEVLGEMSLDLESSMEGLQSKLDRWRAEVPPVYDLSDLTSYLGHRSSTNTKSSGGRPRRRTTSDSDVEGTFSCFGRICGLECSIVCGGPTNRKKRKSLQARRSRSVDSLSNL